MKSACLIMLGSVLVMMALSGVAFAGSKVQICHLPPGSPANFHTITVSEKALQAHLTHGDLPGSCFGNANMLCDDGDACTIDIMDEATETCATDHPPVDCNDSLLCTVDSCDPATGCQYAPIVCDDGDLCTVDLCNQRDGQCTGIPIDCGPLGVCLADTGQCDFPCDGITCEPIDQCHEPGECVLPGECPPGSAVADGTECDDGDASTTGDQCLEGVCKGSPAASGCPCWTLEELDNLPQITFALDCVYMPDYFMAYWRGFDGDPELGPARFGIAAVRDFGTYEDTCQYRTYCTDPLECDEVKRMLYVTPEEHEVCKAQVLSEGYERGYGCIPSPE